MPAQVLLDGFQTYFTAGTHTTGFSPYLDALQAVGEGGRLSELRIDGEFAGLVRKLTAFVRIMQFEFTVSMLPGETGLIVLPNKKLQCTLPPIRVKKPIRANHPHRPFHVHRHEQRQPAAAIQSRETRAVTALAWL